MSELEFNFVEVIREIDDFYEIAKGFLDPSAERCLKQFHSDLSIIRSAAALANPAPPDGGREHSWQIPDSQPLYTRASRAYERGERSGGPQMRARLTCRWDIKPFLRRSAASPPERFRVTGVASVRIDWLRVRNNKPDRPLGMWRMEVADGASPGCFFHAQILGESSRVHPPFPRSIPVPRLPCIAFTPMTVLEFVLGELFQDQWELHTRIQSPNVDRWRAIQQKRLSRLFAWHQELIQDKAAPPWTNLKSAKPPPDLFQA